jgi:diadenosine tetraphosphatase ApaH/serine/threonine PP2A family protein phosphatase
MDALRSVDAATRPICLFGHTHVPAMFRLGPSGAGGDPYGRTGRELDTTVPIRGFPFRLQIEARSRYLLNCGAVGQPRDLDARAAFGLFDSESQSLTFIRTSYDITTAQEKIVEAGLPEVLAQRLAVGR